MPFYLDLYNDNPANTLASMTSISKFSTVQKLIGSFPKKHDTPKDWGILRGIAEVKSMRPFGLTALQMDCD